MKSPLLQIAAAALAAVLLAGCASGAPALPEPSGECIPVNAPSGGAS
ncbi:hypothetical protein MAF45_01275 [Mesosutterella sp. OilRF-GAM-744-9]|uniref:Lipoprotein n=1 Tax=Mesosutterella porci TaxID=2915351 RepID=A0ABS9MN81_9BURK|nr:hypothetical protein [Mesosutterella sp. oilRF-744-WT-GAM-9]MCG5030086.1 hypothetical protein [Mesosutterella sp. oilRF-744-WT-GAM-9]